ncbi:efflux transporter outer membrane subunit [Amphritea opalescens]|nr:efflux transporter outer membrane subunit [Amphritea opalescens]
MTKKLQPLPLANKALFNTVGMTVSILLLTGCAVGPNFQSPSANTDAAVNVVNLTNRQDYNDPYPVSNHQLSSHWWALFNDPALSNLIVRSQAANLDLQIMTSRIEQSRANLGITSAEGLPSLSSTTSYSRERISEKGRFAALGAPTDSDNFWQLGFDATWELDLWGHIQRAEESATAAFKATLYDKEMFNISLAAEVARHYLQFRSLQAQLNITQQNQEIAQQKVKLVASQARNGLAAGFEISMAEAQLATINAQRPKLKQRRNAQLNSLALLLGEPPRVLDELLTDAIALPSLPDEIPIGIPATLVQRRPDILQAEAKLHQATADIGVAKADFYPRITLTGNAGLQGFDSHDLSSWDARFFSVGPSVYLPIFQGGRLKQRLKLTQAKQKEAALSYRKTVLTAWHEVDNALDGLASQRSQVEYLNVAFKNNQQALHFAQRKYEQGVGNYLEVLTAQRNLLNSQMALNDSETNATLRLVTLYKALGGGWDNNLVDTSLSEQATLSPTQIKASNTALAIAQHLDEEHP